MNSEDALQLFAALAQETRLAVFRTLINRGPMTAGDLATELAATPSTLSAHLRDLRLAGLISSQKQGRFVIFEADLTKVDALVSYLLIDCCDGRPAACASALGSILHITSEKDG